MIKNDYSRLDEAILVRLGAEPAGFHVLEAAVRGVAGTLSPDPWRLTDRRLQALRKAGKIVTEKGKWGLV